MANQFDGVIEAVRYAADGRILMVRGYERRGAAFSDHVLISREALVAQLKKGKKFVVGTRKEFYGSSFETKAAVSLINQNGQEIVSTSKESKQDQLENVPLF